ncbi:MAG: hypothetical protein J4473_02365 [Candidatus Aenigmarchaeota archaeon]|nr:hypothetical protein [Candidatus Aenigmarchaeota archaeon]
MYTELVREDVRKMFPSNNVAVHTTPVVRYGETGFGEDRKELFYPFFDIIKSGSLTPYYIREERGEKARRTAAGSRANHFSVNVVTAYLGNLGFGVIILYSPEWLMNNYLFSNFDKDWLIPDRHNTCLQDEDWAITGLTENSSDPGHDIPVSEGIILLSDIVLATNDDYPRPYSTIEKQLKDEEECEEFGIKCAKLGGEDGLVLSRDYFGERLKGLKVFYYDLRGWGSETAENGYKQFREWAGLGEPTEPFSGNYSVEEAGRFFTDSYKRQFYRMANHKK